MVPFVRAMLDHFAGSQSSRPTEQRASISSPQPDQPPAAVVKAMQWMPRPSIRTAVGLGVAAVAMLAAASRRVA
jgi:protease I